MSDVTEFSQVAFDKRFKFLADMEQNEKKILSKKLRKVKEKITDPRFMSDVTE